MNYEKKYNAQKKVVLRQANEIDRLKQIVSELKTDGKDKEELIASILVLKDEMLDCIGTIEKQRVEYDKLISDLRQMRDAMNRIVYNGKWRFLKIFLK